MNHQAYRLILSFGSNLGDRETHFTIALNFLSKQDPSFKLLTKSVYLETSPFQGGDQNSYLNFICDCRTDVHPLKFYQDFIVPIEDSLGHSRKEKWAPRALDIDILLSALDNAKSFADCSAILCEGENFHIPHKRLLDLERKILQDLLKETFNLTDEHLQCHFSHLTEKN